MKNRTETDVSINKAISIAAKKLKDCGVDNSWLDAKILLMHTLHLSKEEIFLRADLALDKTELDNFLLLVKEREKRIPISHIIGRREFYGRDFEVNSKTLDPRADTETLIEAIIANYPSKEKKLKILELGTGTGCIAVTLALEFNNALVTAVDISQEALEIAKRNINKHIKGNRVNILQSNFFSILDQGQKFDIIVSNPPYIKTSEIDTLQEEVKTYEPRLALDGGESGLDCYLQIAKDAKNYLDRSGKIFFEIGQGQEEDVCNIMTNEGYRLLSYFKDLNNIKRALSFEKGS